MATRNHTDADFNKLSREIECKLAIYLNEIPLEVTSHDYIVSVKVSEESSAESTNPLGVISANELEITLLNTNGMFSPQNATGPYYGKIKTGIKIIPFFRLVDSTDTLNWIQLGVFYVSEWTAAVTGSTASVYALDIMKKVLSGDSAEVQVMVGYTFKAFYEYYMSVLGFSILVDSALSSLIPYAYATTSIRETLSELTCAAKAMCYSNRTGTLVVNPIQATRALRASLTDADQIVSVQLTQSTLKTYDGVDFTYVYPQTTLNESILEVDALEVPTGTYVHKAMSFDNGPIAAVAAVALQTIDKALQVPTFSYTPWTITISTSNSTGAKVETNLSVKGTLVEFTDTVISDNTDNMLAYSNKYIQTEALAVAYKAFLNAYVSNDIPTLTVKIRGNLLLNIGDKINVQSTRYGINFTGIIQRATHTYQGYLSTTLTLLNSVIMEVA